MTSKCSIIKRAGASSVLVFTPSWQASLTERTFAESLLISNCIVLVESDSCPKTRFVSLHKLKLSLFYLHVPTHYARKFLLLIPISMLDLCALLLQLFSQDR